MTWGSEQVLANAAYDTVAMGSSTEEETLGLVGSLNEMPRAVHECVRERVW